MRTRLFAAALVICAVASTGQMNDAAYSKAHPTASVTTCEWSANHGFLICDQLIQSADGPRNDLSIYTWNEKSADSPSSAFRATIQSLARRNSRSIATSGPTRVTTGTPNTSTSARQPNSRPPTPSSVAPNIRKTARSLDSEGPGQRHAREIAPLRL